MDDDAFCAIPSRATSDPRLSTSHFRVMMAIAYHDRMSQLRGKGLGCFAGLKTLSRETLLDGADVSRYASDLVRFGYATVRPDKKDRRRRVYRLIYDLNLPMVGDSPNHSPAAPAPAPILGDSPKHEGEILGTPPAKAADLAEVSGPNIFREAVIDSAEAEEILLKRGIFNGSTGQPGRLQYGEIIAKVRRIFPTLSKETATSILMEAGPAYEELERAATSEQRVGEIVRAIAQRARQAGTP